MKQEEIEMQLWEYIDGTCNDADRERISLLIMSDAMWKQKYQVLSSLHAGIADSIEAEQPSMRFTRNVMDAVSTIHVAHATKQYLNPGIIRGIAAFFIVAIVAALGYAIAFAKWDTGTGEFFPRLNLSGLFSNGFFNLIVCLNIVLGLILLDKALRRNFLTRTIK